MKTRTATANAMLVLAALTLAACDGGNEPRKVKKITVGNNSADIQRLRGLSARDRNLTLRRAIQDAGQKCRRVESSGEVGAYENLSMWQARCDKNLDWAIFIAPIGDVQVRSCSHLARLGLPTCKTGKAR
jgi:hypothetical protein